MSTKNSGKKEEKIGEALIKVALGYQIAEVTEEYAEVDGELKLTKRKKTKQDVPPDLKAVQLLLASEGEEFTSWTDEELETERQRLLKNLQESEEKTEKKQIKKVKKSSKTAKTGSKTTKKVKKTEEKK